MLRQQVTVEARLEIARRDEIFTPASAGYLQEAKLLALSGRTLEALHRAQELTVENYGHCRDVAFRVVEVEVRVSMLGAWSGFSDHPSG